MPSLFFSYDAEHHGAKILRETHRPDPRLKKAALEAEKEADIDVWRNKWVERDLRAFGSCSDQRHQKLKK